MIPPTSLPTLSQQVKKRMVWLAILLFFSCLILLLVFSWRSIDLLSNQFANLQADNFISQLKNNPKLAFPSNRQNSVFKHWQDLPNSIKQHLIYEDLAIGESRELIIQSDKGQFYYVYVLLKNDKDLGELIFVSQHSENEIEHLAMGFLIASFKNAVWVVAIIFIVLFFIIRWLINESSKPLRQLSQWSNNLPEMSKETEISHFGNQETNYIAQKIYDNIQRIESFNCREQSFLKHASHEFRTPLAIIQASLDTLELADPENHSVQRALRATKNMNRLTTSLLWIARESKKSIQKELIYLPTIVQDILQNLQYLQEKKSIDLVLSIDKSNIEIEKELLIIVLNNLIRNAFEHVSEGKVHIVLTNSYFEIRNDFEHNEEEVGFGLGLALTDKICNKYGWNFNFSIHGDLALAKITWFSE